MELLIELIRIVAIFAIPLTIVPILVWLERRIAAAIQSRVGPNRVGPFGLLQPLADALKFIFKEDIIPAGADKVLYVIAPLLVYFFPILAFACIPMGIPLVFGEQVIPLQVADFEAGVLFYLAIASLGVYGIALGGWSSNNKYALFGGVRSSAQLISYEIPLGLAVLAVLMTTGSLRMSEIVIAQYGDPAGPGGFWNWNCFRQPVAFVLFFICALAETNRAPFDLPEAEAELVAGYHTEYSSMKFAMFFMGEYIAMIGMSALMTTLFLGGWQHGIPGVGYGTGVFASLLTFAIFWSKVMLILLVYMWIRWTVPRFRYDQLMDLGWKKLIPVGLLNLAVTGVVGVLDLGVAGTAVMIAIGFGAAPWLFRRMFVAPPGAPGSPSADRYRVPAAFGPLPAPATTGQAAMPVAGFAQVTAASRRPPAAGGGAR